MHLDSSHPRDLGLCPQRTARLQAIVQDEIARRRSPGAVLLIARHGKIGVFEALGAQDPATGVPMAPDAIFRLYSMTKPIVSVAAMMLMEQGKFLLCDPVAKYLPEFDGQQVAVERDGLVTLHPVTRPATVHDLLRHTAGLTYEFSGSSAACWYCEQQVHVRVPGQDLAGATRVLAAIPLMFQPAGVGDYSRATDVLGRLVQVWSGQSLVSSCAATCWRRWACMTPGFCTASAARAHRATLCTRPGRRCSGRDVRCSRQAAAGIRWWWPGGYCHGLRAFPADVAEQGPARRMCACWARRIVDYMTCDHLGDIPANDSLLRPGEGFGAGFACVPRRV